MNKSQIGYLDGIRSGQIEGWAFDPKNADKPVILTMYVDGMACKSFEAKIFRDDLLSANMGNGNLAYYESIPKRFYDGQTHKIEVRFASTGAPLEGSPLKVELPKYEVSSIAGFLDTVNEREIAGWVLDKNSPEDALQVEIIVDGSIIAVTSADRRRDDLVAANIGTGRHGFSFVMPSHFLDSVDHHVAARVLNTNLFIEGGQTFNGTANKWYRNFAEYLNWATHFHEINAPFTEVDKTIVAEMLWLNEHYSRSYSSFTSGPIVSIIMPTYNRATLIREAINSVVKQDYQSWELIIVDDFSDDNTSEVVAAYRDQRIKYYRMDKNCGPSAARRYGMKQATGSYFAYLDSDNTWDGRFLRVMIGLLNDNKYTHSAYCAQLIFSKSSGDNKVRKSIRYAPFNQSLLENSNYIDLNCFVHDREVYEIAGEFDSEIRMLEDWDLILRYSNAASPMSIPCLLSHYFRGKAKIQVTFSGDFSDTVKHIAEKNSGKPLDLNYPSAIMNDFNHLPAGLKLQSLQLQENKEWTRRPVSILIPSFEAGAYLDLALQSIYKYTPKGTFEIVIVDNASIGSALAVLAAYKDKANVKIVQNNTNYGYSYAINQAIMKSEPENDLIFFNNDAVVTPGWLEGLWEVCDRYEDAGLIVPRQVLVPRTPTMEQHVPSCQREIEIDVNLSAHHQNVINPLFDTKRGIFELNFAAFFCVYVPRAVANQIGMLDDKNGRHYRSDSMYCDAVRYLARKKILYTPHSKVYHFLQRATGDLAGIDPELYNIMFSQNKWMTTNIYEQLFD